MDEQTRLHEVDQNGANLSAEEGLQHSNLHIGELTWGADPASQEDTPSPSITIEVDYYADAEFDTLANETWENGIEQNYALYGIDIDIIRDEVINNSQTEWTFMGVNPDDGFGVTEITTVAEQYNNRDSDEYVLVANEGDGLISDTQTGVNIRGVPYQAIFIRGNQNAANRIPEAPVRQSIYIDALALMAAKTQIHEVGHSLKTGEADDSDDAVAIIRSEDEIYSGEGEDPTPENATISGQDRIRWSIMTSGWNPPIVGQPMNGRYFVYSIEEVVTVDED